MSAPVLELCDVSVVRDRQRLVSHVGLTVAPGTIHFLVGPNGAGKSTLFQAILGLLDFEGSIRFQWRNNGRIGYVPQFFAVDRTIPLTVGEFLAMSRQRRPICFGTRRGLRQPLEQLLARVGLDGSLRQRALSALSGGELQKLLLANAIDPTPEMLLLDEPASGLDETAARQMERLLLEMKQASTGVLMVSHDLEHARRIADHVTLIDREVLRSGSPAQVLDADVSAAFHRRGAQVVS
jgi:zinc transport system ATP-binding protein